MDVKNLIVWALETSMHVEPRKPGLTPAELVELGAGLGAKSEEITNQLRGRAMEGGRVLPFGIDPSFFGTYAGDLRNILAFDHVVAAFNQVHRAAAGRPPMASREAILASGAVAGLPRVDLELAIATYRAFEGAPEADDRWELRRLKAGAALPTAQRTGPAGVKLTKRERYTEIAEGVRAILERRSPKPAAPQAAAPAAAAARTAAAAPAPGRSAPSRREQEPQEAPDEADPAADGEGALAEFGAILPALGQDRLVPWWKQLAADYRAADPARRAATRCFLAASMAESALHLTCRKAGIPKPDPKATKVVRLNLTELARIATAIGFDGDLRSRLEQLSKTRQRIQSTRLVEGTGTWAEITPRDAREASDTLETMLRAILDWQLRAGHRSP